MEDGERQGRGSGGGGKNVRVLAVSGVSTLCVEGKSSDPASAQREARPTHLPPLLSSSFSLENDTFHGTFTYFSRFYEGRLETCVDVTWRLAVDAAILRRKIPRWRRK